ncbi:hypothetical protein GYMLUDRAFT_108860, partial [Collybiopsis luxurians FD-317 M1]
EDIRIAQQFINTLCSVSLDQTGLSEEAVVLLLQPEEDTLVITDSNEDCTLLLSLELFIGLARVSEAKYAASRAVSLRRYPSSNVGSYAQVKWHIATLMGINTIIHNMCANSCMAYTGPFGSLNNCLRCQTPR